MENAKTPLEQAQEYAKGDVKIQAAFRAGFIAGTIFQLRNDMQIVEKFENEFSYVLEKVMENNNG